MADEAKQESVDEDFFIGHPGKPFPPAEETVIPTKWGAVGIAIRTAETADSFRALITIRYGRNPQLIKFDFGKPGGVSTFGGDPGDPPCP